MNGIAAQLRLATGDLVGAARTLIRRPLAWLLVILIWTLVNLGLAIIPVIGTLAITLLTPVFWGGILQNVPAYREGHSPRPGHLFEAFQDGTQRGRLLAVGAWTLGFFLIVLMLALLLGAIIAPFAEETDPPPLVLGLTGLDWALLLGVVIQGLVVGWFSLALFLALPLVVFQESEAIPALRGASASAMHNLLYLSPILMLFGAYLLADCCLALIPFFLSVPLIILFQERAFRTLEPESDDPDPEAAP